MKKAFTRKNFGYAVSWQIITFTLTLVITYLFTRAIEISIGIAVTLFVLKTFLLMLWNHYVLKYD